MTGAECIAVWRRRVSRGHESLILFRATEALTRELRCTRLRPPACDLDPRLTSAVAPTLINRPSLSLPLFSLLRIDLLVSHSSAVYPTALLWKDVEGPEIKSIAFLNPSGHRRIKAMRPKIVTSVAVRVYRNRLGRGICRTFGTTVLSITGCPVRPDNMDNVILSATTMVYSKFRHVSPMSAAA